MSSIKPRTSIPAQYLWHGDCPGESLLIASDRVWSERQSKDAAIVRALKLLGSFERSFERSIGNDLFQLILEAFLDNLPRGFYARVAKLGPNTSLSVKVEQGSTSSPQWQADPPAPSESSRVSLVDVTSKRGDLSSYSTNPPTPQTLPYPSMDNSFELTTNVAGPSTLLTREEEEQLVLASVRQVVVKSPSYAEEVVLVSKEPSDVKRDILFNHYRSLVEDDTSTPVHSSSDTPAPQIRPHPSTTSPETWEAFRATAVAPKLFESTQIDQGVPETSHVPADALGSPRQVPSGQPSQAKGGSRQTGKCRVQKLSGGKPTKKDERPDEGGDGSGSGGGGGSSPPMDEQNKSDSRWACPYCLAFPHMLKLTKFKSCRPSGSLNSRSLWKDHLKEYHSPKARLSNNTAAHASFYMNDEQWSAVQARIAVQKRPRPYSIWFKVQKECFLDVWRIIFPRTRFPQLNEPLSPFNPDSSELANLKPQSRILLEAICHARARRAVSTGSIATVQDFHPSGEEHMEMMEEAVAIMANRSPSASQWLVNVSPEGLQAAVEDHNQASPGPEAKNLDSENVTSPEPTPEPSPSGTLTDPVTASPSTFPRPAEFDPINKCIDPRLLGISEGESMDLEPDLQEILGDF